MCNGETPPAQPESQLSNKYTKRPSVLTHLPPDEILQKALFMRYVPDVDPVRCRSYIFLYVKMNYVIWGVVEDPTLITKIYIFCNDATL